MVVRLSLVKVSVLIALACSARDRPARPRALLQLGELGVQRIQGDANCSRSTRSAGTGSRWSYRSASSLSTIASRRPAERRPAILSRNLGGVHRSSQRASVDSEARSFARHRPRVGPILPMGMPSDTGQFGVVGTIGEGDHPQQLPGSVRAARRCGTRAACRSAPRSTTLSGRSSRGCGIASSSISYGVCRDWPRITRQASRRAATDQPLQHRPRVGDRVGVRTRASQVRLQHVLGRFLVQPLGAHGVPQDRGQHRDQLPHRLLARRRGSAGRPRRRGWRGFPVRLRH